MLSTLPPLESTIQIETGSGSDINLGDDLIELNANVSGVRRLIYNQSFWSNDFLTTTPSNSCILLVIGYYPDPTSPVGPWYLTGFPITLPHISIAAGSPAGNNIVQLQQSLAYALNLLFSKQGIRIGPAPTNFDTLAINDPTCPILQDTTLPPLQWKVTPNGTLALIPTNETFYNQFRFQIFPIPNNFFNIQSDQNWFNKGPFLFGFGNLTTDQSGTYAGDTMSNLEGGIPLMQAHTPIPQDYQTFLNDFSATGAGPLIIGLRTAACISSRVFAIQSSQFTRLQLRPPSSNLTYFSKNTSLMGLLFATLPTKNTFHDITLSSGKNQVSEATQPNVNFDPLFGGDVLDISIQNEFSQTLSSPPTTLEYIQRESLDSSTFSTATIPAAYQPLDPYFSTNGPRHDSLFAYSRINQNYFVFAESPFFYQLTPAASIIHFARAIGY